MAQRKGEIADNYKKLRKNYENIYPDLRDWFIGYWEKCKIRENILYEYEQYFQKTKYDRQVEVLSDSPVVTELLEFYRRLCIHPDKEIYDNLIQAYSDLGCYNKASAWNEDLADYLSTHREESKIQFEKHKEEGWNPDSDNLHRYATLFVGREDIYAEEKTEHGRRMIYPKYEPLTEEVLRRHLCGEITVETYVQMPPLDILWSM